MSVIIFFSFLVTFSGSAKLGDAFGETLDSVADSGGAGYNVEVQDPSAIVADVIQVALGFLGVIFVVLMVYGGYTYMVARGNEQEVEKAMNTIQRAVIGLIIVVSAYAISILVLKSMSGLE